MQRPSDRLRVGVLRLAACALTAVTCASAPPPRATPARADFAVCLQLIQRNYVEEVHLNALYQATLRALAEDFELELGEADGDLTAVCDDRSATLPARIRTEDELLGAELDLSVLLAGGCTPRIPLWREIPPLRAFTYRFVGSLDPDSRYLAREAAADFQARGSFDVGLAVAEDAGKVVITEVYAGTPAWQADLRAGDRIHAIDGASVEGLSLGKVTASLRGAEGSTVEIGLIRGDGGTATSQLLRREQVRVSAVQAPVWLEDIAYVRMRRFLRGTPQRLRTILESTVLATTLILDLRANGGGILDAVVQSADLFVLRDTPIGQVLARSQGEARKFLGGPTRLPTPDRVFVLVDRHTASGAELFAEALRDAGVATLVGEKTFGRGTIQTLYPLDDGSGVKITTGVLVAGERGAIPAEGLVPDLEVEGYGGGVPTPDRDVVLRAVLSAL